MGKKTLTNTHCLLDLIEQAPVSVLKTFSGLAECQALARGFDWSRNEAALCASLLEHIKHLRNEQRPPAEREALRVMRLASPRGAVILSTVADQLDDTDLQEIFTAQAGGEFGRSVWMRTHSDDTIRLFDVAEILGAMTVLTSLTKSIAEHRKAETTRELAERMQPAAAATTRSWSPRWKTPGAASSRRRRNAMPA